SETASFVAWHHRCRAAMDRMVSTSCSPATSRLRRVADRRARRARYPALVAVVQSRSVGRTYRRPTADCRRSDTHKTPGASIDRRWRDGHVALRTGHSGVWPGARRVGDGDAWFFYGLTPASAARGHRARMFSLHGRSHWWSDG